MTVDDQVRDLFKWVKHEESNDVEFATVADEIGNRAIRRYGLKSSSKRLVDKRIHKVAFANTRLIIRHDGLEWQLIEPDDPEA